MPRRVSLPGAAELFRPTDPDGRSAADGEDARGAHETGPTRESGESPVRGSGRVRHDEKITVYVSTDELLALEQARLRLRSEYGTAVDRGRMVREAVSMALEEFEAQGSASPFVHRLTDT